MRKYPIYEKGVLEGDDLQAMREQWVTEVANDLSTNALATLVGLMLAGPLYDGDVPSKIGRDELLELGLCVKILVSGNAIPEACPKYVETPSLSNTDDRPKGYTDGYQAATYRGSDVYQKLVELGRFKP